MRKIEPELITGMGYIGDNPGVLYRMGGAGEQTVVTGNPALLEGVKGSRFTSLAIYGKSTQGSTTGAQLLDINNLTDVSNYPNTAIAENGGLSKRNEDLSSPDRYLINVIPNMQYSISAVDFVNGAVLQISDLYQKGESESVVDTRIYAQRKQVEFNSGKYEQLTLSFFSPQLNTEFKATHIMLNAGSAALLWEPYTGGAPSPSPSYPQEIESAGQSGEIGIEVGNNGYIQKGTYFSNVRPFSLKKGYTYHIEREKAIANINCFVLNEYNKSLTNSSVLYDYGYTTKKLTTINATGIVDKECRMPMKYDKVGYTFTVKSEGLYLYQAVNTYTENTDELYIGYAPNILNEEYKKQTLIIPTPGGLPGIPVSTGGNYTDEKGQQWVADEIDLARGERVQWIGKHELTGKENVADFGLSPRTRMVSIAIPDAYIDAGNHGYLKAVMSNKYKQAKCSELKDDINLIARGQQRNICFSIPTDVGIEDFKTDLSNQYASGRPVKVYYKLATPIRTPLPPETIAAYKSLKTYSPTTTVINDAGAGMIVGYKRRK